MGTQCTVIGILTYSNGSTAQWAGHWISVISGKQIFLYDSKTLNIFWKVPKFQYRPRFFSFCGKTLLILYNNNIFRLFNTEKKRMIKWSIENESLLGLISPVNNIYGILECQT